MKHFIFASRKEGVYTMREIILTTAQNKAIELQEKIKRFTKEQPSDMGIADPSYKSYLAQCAQLYELDKQLTALHNLDLEPEDFENQLTEIEKEVNRLTFANV